jgi:osmoprotectant transport system permease protein
VGETKGTPGMSVLTDFWDYITSWTNWTGAHGIFALTWAHIRISVLATLVAMAFALPTAIWMGHHRRGGIVAVSVVNIGRAIPSLAFIAFFNAVGGIFGFGYRPTLIALIALAIPPMFTNGYTGVRDVDPSIVEAARGMGMTTTEVLLKVEVPTALPLLITGVRISALQVVATATLGAFVAFECLGTLITQGIAQFDNGKLVTGAVLVALLALITDGFFVVVQRVLTPWLRRRGRRVHRVRRADVDPVASAVPVT